MTMKNRENKKFCTSPMTLDEAIAHAEDIANRCDTSCGREHRQLADWLKELRDLKNQPVGNAAAMREACAKMRQLLMLRGDGKERCILSWDEFNESQKMLRAALSAQPHKGKWENGTMYEYEYAYCSECGRMQWAGWYTHKQAEEEIELFADNYRFCPGCGTEMEGGVYVKTNKG